MDEKYFTPAERDAALPLVAQLLRDTREIILPDDFKKPQHNDGLRSLCVYTISLQRLSNEGIMNA